MGAQKAAAVAAGALEVEMIVYEVSLQLVSVVHAEVMPLARSGDRELARQLQRAVRSVALNIAEALGFSRCRRQANHFRIALGSGRETVARLRLLEATGVVPAATVEPAFAQGDRSSG